MAEMSKEEFLNSIKDGNTNFHGKDLSGLWLTLSDYSGFDFSGCDLRGTNFAKSILENCSFIGADLRGTNFDYSDVHESDFTDAKVSWKTSNKNFFEGSAVFPTIPKFNGDVTKPIIQGDITTVSEEVWANEWRVHAPDKENVLSFGGSFLGDLFDVNEFACSLESINEKKGIFARQQKPKNKESFDAGHLFEPVVAESFKRYMEERGHKVELITDTNMYQHPLHPYFLADMDYLVKVDGELCILECKTCSTRRWDEIERLRKRILNKAYFLQVNGYLSIGWLIAKITTCYVCDMWGHRADDDNMAVIKVTRDEETEEKLFKELDAMYDAIKNEEEISTENMNPYRLSDYYRRLYGELEDEFKTVTLSQNCTETIEEILMYQNEISQHTEEIRKLKEERLPKLYNSLSGIFGDSLHGCLPIEGTDEFYAIDRNPFGRNYHLDVERLAKEFPLEFKGYCNKVIKTTTLNSLVERLERGMITVAEFKAEIDGIEEVFDEKAFIADNKKGTALQAPYSHLYKKELKSSEDKAPNVFTVKRSKFSKKTKTA